MFRKYDFMESFRFHFKLKTELADLLENHEQEYAINLRKCGENVTYTEHTNTTTNTTSYKIKNGFFCGYRFCPLCQWRKRMKLTYTFKRVIEKISDEYRFIFLTLTVKSCRCEELKPLLQRMNTGWFKLSHYTRFPGKGYIRSLEITKSLIDEFHPHFHVLISVEPSYFEKGENNYLTTNDWVQMWRKAMNLEYDPICDIRAIQKSSITNIISEVVKYSIKPYEYHKNISWLLCYINAFFRMRAICSGGNLAAPVKIRKKPIGKIGKIEKLEKNLLG